MILFKLLQMVVVNLLWQMYTKIKGNDSDELVIVLHSVIDNDLKTSLVQAKTVFSCLPIFKKFQT